MNADKRYIRPLTEWEMQLKLIKCLLSKPFLGRDELLEQASHAAASQVDENGGLYLKTLSEKKAPVKHRVPVEGWAPDIDGVLIHYLLFVDDDGKVCHFDVFKEDGSRVQRHAKPEELELLIMG